MDFEEFAFLFEELQDKPDLNFQSCLFPIEFLATSLLNALWKQAFSKLIESYMSYNFDLESSQACVPTLVKLLRAQPSMYV